MSKKLPLSLLVAGASALSTITLFGATTAFSPNDPLVNPALGFQGQWHLFGTSDLSVVYPSVDASGNPIILPAWLSNVKGNNVVGAWSMGYTGKGVVIGISDDGVEGTHEDLAQNYRIDLSKNFSDGDVANMPQGPYQKEDMHGVSVAGVAAARGGNNIGVTGAAPYAQLAGMRHAFTTGDGDPAPSEAQYVKMFLWKSGTDSAGTYLGDPIVQIQNHSWGPTTPFLLGDPNGRQREAMRAATKNGVIFVYAAGNARGTFFENGNADWLCAGEHGINVAAFGADGVFAPYSDYGSSVFITAASSNDSIGIVTTDRTGSDGYTQNNYNGGFGGTSSAAPLVSGIMALGKEAAPAMDTRWAKHAMVNASATTPSMKVDPNDKSLTSGIVDWSTTKVGIGWQTNGAGNSFNPNYGFGLLDAAAFVNQVVRVAYVTERTSFAIAQENINVEVYAPEGGAFTPTTPSSTSGPIVVGHSTRSTTPDTRAAGTTKADAATPDSSAPERNPDGQSFIHTFKLSSAEITQAIETVEVHVNITSGPVWRNLLLRLVSPSGVVSDLYTPLLNAPTAEETSAATSVGANNGVNWTFTTNAFWGESTTTTNGTGEWQFIVQNFGYTPMNIKDFSITFNQGESVLENTGAPLIIDKVVNAHALAIDLGTFVLKAGKTFTVTDSTSLAGGSIEVGGHIAETAFKGNQVRISDGTMTILPGGAIDAKRGATMSGGILNLAGALNTGNLVRNEDIADAKGNLSTAAVTYNCGLLMTGGTINVGDAGTIGTGIIQTAGDINIPAGKRLTTPLLDAGGTFDADGKRTAAASVNLTGGSLVGTLIARDGALVTASGDSVFAGDVTITGTDNTTGAQFSVAPNSNVSVTGKLTIAGGTTRMESAITAGEIIVTGGQIISTVTDAQFASQVTVGGGTLKLNDSATFTRELTLAGGTFETADKTVTAPQIAIRGNGALSPGGAAPVILPVQGNIAVSQAGSLKVDLLPGATAQQINGDKLNVSGKVAFNGGYIEVSDTSIAPQFGIDDYTLITAQNGITGTPAAVKGAYTERAATAESNYMIPVAFKFVIDPTDNKLGILYVGYDYASVKFADQMTPNQLAIGHALNDLDRATTRDANNNPESELLQAINGITDHSALENAYDQLMPVNLLTISRSATKQANALTGTFDRRTRTYRRGAIQPGSIWTNYLFAQSYGFDYSAHPLVAANGKFTSYVGQDEEHPLTLWMNGGGSFWKGKDDGFAPTTKSTQYTGLIGLDYAWNTDYSLRYATYSVGLIAGYNNTTDKIGSGDSENELNGISVSAYFTGSYNGFFGNALASYSINSYDFRRQIAIPGMTPVLAKASPDGAQYVGYINGGYEWEYREWMHGPIVSLQYALTKIDGYSETGAGSQNLTIGDQDFDSLLASVGYRISTRVKADWATLLPEFRISYNHEFLNDATGITSSMNIPGSRPFTVYTSDPGRDYVNVGLGLTVLLSETVSLSLDYDATLFQKHMDPQHTVNAMLRVSF